MCSCVTTNPLVSPSDLRNGSAIFWEGGVSGGYETLLLDEDQGWLLVGGKDHVYLLRPDSPDQSTRTVRHTNIHEKTTNTR